MRAFISYRRHDVFSTAGSPDALLASLKGALCQLGFTAVFIDVESIDLTSDWLERIYSAVTRSDLVIALIGERWEDLLAERTRAGTTDILRRELALASRFGKLVLPILVDSATAPKEERLPSDIRYVARRQAVRVTSLSDATTLETALKQVSITSQEFYSKKRVVRRQLSFAVAVSFILSALVPDMVGMGEFGAETWFRIAWMWSGFFIWPVFFVPLAILALFNPCSVVLDAAASAKTAGARFAYLLPFLTAFVLSSAFTYMDGTSDRTAWTLRPGNDCGDHPQAQNERALIRDISHYDTRGTLASVYARRGEIPSWLRSTCWPGVFLYLTLPFVDDAAHEPYLTEREPTRKVFDAIVNGGAWRSLGYHTSYVFIAYTASLFVLIYMVCLLVTLAVFYASYGLRSKSNEHLILNIEAENAFLSFGFGFLIVMSWVPFRMPTHFFKRLVYESYGFSKFFSDIVLAGLFVCALLYIVCVLWRRFQRRAQALASMLATTVFCGLALAVLVFAPSLLQLKIKLQIALMLLMWLVLFALWPLFSTRQVRSRDFVNEYTQT